MRAGANPDGNDSETLLDDTSLDGAIDTADNTAKNDGALFCSDVVGLADGSVMAVGGTDYYTEPGIDGFLLGVAELEGIKNSRIFHAESNTWTQSGDMNIVAAYNPDTQAWTDIGYAGLPLRLDEIGLEQLSSTLNISNLSLEQTTGLVGDLLGSPTELITALDDTNVDADQLKMAIAGGMRGSTSSTMLPLKPDADGRYREVELLTAGGVPSYAALTSPGGYLPVTQSRVDTIRTHGDEIDYESRLTGPLNQPRWYGTNVLMPDGSVMVFNGGNRDGVVGPGLDSPVQVAERFDPETGQWTEMATSNRPRTYHNTAVLLPDGRVLIGGHAPINTAYLSSINLEDFGFSPNDGSDPSFEIYTPPYAERDDHPVIQNAPKALTIGDTFTIQVSEPEVDKVLLIRRSVMTHLIDGDQRAIELPVQARNGHTLTLKMPAHHSVVPAGKYMLFVSKDTAEGRIPSVSAAITVVNHNLECMVPQMAEASTTEDDEEGLLDGATGLLGF